MNADGREEREMEAAEQYERDLDEADVAEQLADDDHDTRHEMPYSGWAVRP